MHERSYNTENESSNTASHADAQTRHNKSPLPIGATNDAHENEADAMANQVTHGFSNGAPQRKPLTPFIQKKENGKDGGSADNVVANQITATKGGGSGLDNETKSFMESCFGASFQNVHIHTGGYASELSNQLNANAFTVGKDVYFGQGKYMPNTSEGKHLLAHELTHTLQQGETAAVQKEDKDKPKTAYAPTPEIDFKVLPPDFQLKLFHFLLGADTSTVHLDYNAKSFMAGLSYKYGDALSLNMRFMDFKTKLGWKPGSNDFSLGMNYKGLDANLSTNPWQQKIGLGLHYGAHLLPMQDQMTSTFNAGGTSFGNLATGLPGAFHDPIAFYQQNKTEIENVSKTVDLVKQITEAGKSKIRFGGDFSLTYDPVNKVLVTAKVGVMF